MQQNLSYGRSLFQEHDFEYNDLTDCIGAGAFAEVFKARLKKDGTGKVLDPPLLVAAKVVTKPSRSQLSPRDEKFMCKEVTILSSLKPHPNVVGMLGFCPNPRHFVLLLEYVNGGSLEDWILSESQENEWPIDISFWNHRIDFACQAAEGLLHLHESHIAHMDMKCANILLQYENNKLVCKIADFGLSKMKNVSTLSRLSQRHSESHGKAKAAGTYQYMTPEQYFYTFDMSSESSRSLVDIYSFGIILWEIRERALIFEGLLIEVIFAHKKNEKIPPNKEECPGCPDMYQSLVRQCYSENPKKRPTSYEILQRLKEMRPHVLKATQQAATQQCSNKSPTFSTFERERRKAESGQDLRINYDSGLASLSTFTEDVIRQLVEQMKAEIGDAGSFKNAGKLIHRIASTILKDPRKQSVRRVNTESKTFGPDVWSYVEARALLFHVGFEWNDDKRIHLSLGANLKGLKILCSLFEDLFPELRIGDTGVFPPSCAPTMTTTTADHDTNSEGAISAAKSSQNCQTSHTEHDDAVPTLPLSHDLDSLYSVGLLGSLLAFVNHHSHSGHSLREFPSVFAEVKALLSVLFTKDDPRAFLQECWLSIRNDQTNITGPESLANYHKQFKPFVDLVRQNTVKKYGKTSAESQLFEYLDRVTCARPAVNQASQDREFLGSFPHFLDENYLKLPDCISKERFSDAFHQRAESISFLYKIFVDGGDDFAIIQQLIAHLSWIEVFFTSHFFSTFQLKMKEKAVFEDSDFKHRLELTLKLADKLQRFPSAAFAASGLFSAAEFHDDTVSLLGDLEIASCDSQDDILPRLHRFTDGWSHNDLHKDDKMRDFWNLELEIGVQIFQKWGQEYGNAYFFAVTVFLIEGGWHCAPRVNELDKICVTWRGFSHRNVLHFFLPDAADQLKRMVECAEESVVLSEPVNKHVSKITSCLYLFRQSLSRLLKPSLSPK